MIEIDALCTGSRTLLRYAESLPRSSEDHHMTRVRAKRQKPAPPSTCRRSGLRTCRRPIEGRVARRRSVTPRRTSGGVITSSIRNRGSRSMLAFTLLPARAPSEKTCVFLTGDSSGFAPSAFTAEGAHSASERMGRDRLEIKRRATCRRAGKFSPGRTEEEPLSRSGSGAGSLERSPASRLSPSEPGR